MMQQLSLAVQKYYHQCSSLKHHSFISSQFWWDQCLGMAQLGWWLEGLNPIIKMSVRTVVLTRSLTGESCTSMLTQMVDGIHSFAAIGLRPAVSGWLLTGGCLQFPEAFAIFVIYTSQLCVLSSSQQGRVAPCQVGVRCLCNIITCNESHTKHCMY